MFSHKHGPRSYCSYAGKEEEEAASGGNAERKTGRHRSLSFSYSHAGGGGGKLCVVSGPLGLR